MPVFGHLNAAQEAHRPDLLPGHADVPAGSACSAAPPTCRRSSTSASWSRSRPTSGATSRGTTRASCRRSPRRSARRSRRSSTRCSPTAARCGSDEAPRPDHRRLQLLGRPARAGARARRGQRGDHRRLARRPVAARSSARSTSASAPSTRCCGGSSTPPRSTPSSTPAWSSTRPPRSPRVAHEMNVLGTMNILAACGGPDSPVTKVVFKSSRPLLRLRARRPGLLHRGHAAARTRRRPASSPTSSRPTTPSRSFAARNPKVTVTTLRFCNGLGPDLRHQPQRAARRCPRCPGILGFDPRYQFIHEDDIVGALHHAVAHDLPGIHNAAARRRARAERGREPARQAVRAAAAAVGDVAGRPRRPIGSVSAIPDEVRQQLRYGRGLDNRKLKQLRLPLRAHDARDGAGVCRGAAAQTAAGERRGAISLRARSGGVPPLVTERSGATSQAADANQDVAGLPGPPSSRLPSADPMRTRLIVLAAFVAFLGIGGVAGAYFYDDSKKDLIAEGVKVNGVPIGGHDARRRRRRSSPPTLLAPLDRPVKVRYKDRTFTLTQKAAAIGIDIRGSVDKALKRSQEGDMFSRTLAQPAQRVAQHRAGGRRHLQQAVDRQARQARAQVARAQAGGREGRPREGLHRRATAPRPACA